MESTKQPLYPPSILWWYDAWLTKVANPYIWGCSTDTVLRPFFERNKGLNHCDIGVGTGYYLATSAYHPKSRVTLIDIEPTPLSHTTQRLQTHHPNLPIQAYQHNILSSEPFAKDQKFDSISLMYLFHCLPVPIDQKLKVFKTLKRQLKPTGVVYGVTVLGQGVWHGYLAKLLLRILQRQKFLVNERDYPEDFERGLKEEFEHVWVERVGSVLMFEARGPIIDVHE